MAANDKKTDEPMLTADQMNDKSLEVVQAQQQAEAVLQSERDAAAASAAPDLTRLPDLAKEQGKGKYLVLHTAVGPYRQGESVDFADDVDVQRLIDEGAVVANDSFQADQPAG